VDDLLIVFVLQGGDQACEGLPRRRFLSIRKFSERGEPVRKEQEKKAGQAKGVPIVCQGEGGRRVSRENAPTKLVEGRGCGTRKGEKL